MRDTREMTEARIESVETAPETEALPIDVRTMALSLWQRRWAMAMVILVGLAAGALVGWTAGERVYSAETTLKFASVSDREPLESDLLALTTNMNLVKIPENLLRLRERLQLPISLQGLGSAVDASVRRNTGLLVIRARAGRPGEAADIANTMRDVFLERQLQHRLESELEAMGRLRLRLEERQALIDLQLDQLEVVESEMRQTMERDREASPAAEGLGDINIRVERLRDAIFDDTRQRANLAEYAHAELEFEKAEELFESGVISETELEAARAEFGRWKALAIDTEQTKAWRDEVDRLQAVALPSTDSATSPAMNVLQEMLLKNFHLRLERVELREKLAKMEEQTEQLQQAVAGLAAGLGETAVLEVRFEPLFRLVSAAVPPVYPEHSNRRMVALAVAAVVILLGLLATLAVELLDTTVKSGPDLGKRLRVPVLASLPRLLESAPGCLDSATEVRFQQLAARLRMALAPDGRRALLVSHGSGEGRRAVTRRLADILARQDLRVLIVGGDWAGGSVHPLARAIERLSSRLDRPGLRPLRRFVAGVLPRVVGRRGDIREESASRCDDAADSVATGASNWSRWSSGDGTAVEAMIGRTLTEGVDQLGLLAAGIPVEALGSQRFAALLGRLAERYDILLLSPPPCSEGAWGEMLTAHTDIVITVAGARRFGVAEIRRDLDALATYQRPLAGAVVTGLESPFLELG